MGLFSKLFGSNKQSDSQNILNTGSVAKDDVVTYESFYGDIIRELGLDRLPEDKKIAILSRIGELIFQATLIRVLDAMSDQESNNFNKYFDENQSNPDVIFHYLSTNVRGFNSILNEEIAGFKARSAEVMGL